MPISENSSYKRAAFAILSKAQKPLHYKDITNQAIEAGLITTRGKTPEATMNSQLTVDVNLRGQASLFVKEAPGVFGLRSHMANIYDPGHVPTHAYFLLGVKVLVVNPQGSILLLQRSDKVSRSQGWDFPGGGVDKGEDPSEAALREVSEETGLDVHDLQVHTTCLIKSDGEDALILGYVARTDNDVVNLGWEHEDFRWIALDELREVKLPQEHKAIVEAYEALV